MEGADSSRNGRRDGMVTNPGDGHTVWSRSSPPVWIESTVKSAFSWRKRFRVMVALMRTWSASRKETMTRVANADPLWTMQSTHSFSVPGGAWQERLSVGKRAHNSPLTRWSLLCSNLNKNGYLSSSYSSPWWWKRGSSMGVQSGAMTRASWNRIGACTRGSVPCVGLAVRVDRGRNLFIPPLIGAASRTA